MRRNAITVLMVVVVVGMLLVLGQTESEIGWHANVVSFSGIYGAELCQDEITSVDLLGNRGRETCERSQPAAGAQGRFQRGGLRSCSPSHPFIAGAVSCHSDRRRDRDL